MLEAPLFSWITLPWLLKGEVRSVEHMGLGVSRLFRVGNSSLLYCIGNRLTAFRSRLQSRPDDVPDVRVSLKGGRDQGIGGFRVCRVYGFRA